MPDQYGGGGFGSYLPALSHLLGEVESPTQGGQMQQPSFGGQPGQLGQILQSPHVQQLLQQFGINFDPHQIRQSPFLPNQFMQHHPQMGGALSGAMANVAATPEAPLVSGAGSGMSRTMQGMMGGPEMQRQYQVHQMLAPFQAMGAQMPAQEFGRKQELLNLLTKMEQHRQQLGQEQFDRQSQQPTKTPYGLIYPGQQTPVPPEMQGQSPQSSQLGSQPLFQMFHGQGQQPFQQQGQPRFEPYDPNMIREQGQAKNPLPYAKADEQRQETKGGMPGAKVDETRSKAEKNRAAGEKSRQGKTPNYGQLSGQYQKAEEGYRKKEEELSRRRGIDPKDPKYGSMALDDAGYKAAQAENLAALQQSKATIDQAQGNPGVSSRGQRNGIITPNAAGGGPPPQMGGPDANKKSKGGKQQGGQNLQKDEAGHVWDMSSGKPVLIQQATPQQQ